MAIICILAVLAVLLHDGVSIQNVTYRYGEPADVVRTADGRISGVRNRRDKDFVFGGLFPVSRNLGRARCGATRTDQRLEAMLFAMDLLNSDNSVLPGFEIGYDLRDTCLSENVGLDETLDLILTGSDDTVRVESCEMSANISTQEVPTLGIVGAALSRVSMPVANLGRLFAKPQISYASSSPLLRDRDTYTYFYRTIPPDDLQARAIIDLLLHFNWTHISTIYSNDAYGRPGTDVLQQLASQYGMCIDLDEAIEDDFDDQDYRNLAEKLIQSDARVVVLFTHATPVDRLLSEIDNSTESRKFIWIGVDSWAQALRILRNHNETVAGLYGLAPLASIVPEFDDYISQLTLQSNRRNPWFPGMFAAHGGCSLNIASVNSCPVNVSYDDLPQRYVQSNFVPLVVDAVYAFAHALQDFLTANCEDPLEWDRINQTCTGQKNELNGSTLLEYIRNVSFTSPTGNRVRFNENGSVEGKYEIMSYYAFDGPSGRTYDLRTVGTWVQTLGIGNESVLLSITETNLQFGIDENGNIRYEPPSSQCGKCRPGEYRREIVSSCCGDCTPCLGQNFSNAPLSPNCTNCSIFGDMWGNNPLRGSNDCVPIDETFLEFSHPLAIIIAVIAIIGLLCTTATAIVFGIYWKSKIVKASGREQMIMLMVGIVLSFLQVFIYLAPPVLGICVVQRIGIWFCFSLMFGAILVKLIRVVRIFMNRSNTHIQFMEPCYQIVFTILIVLGQLVLVIASTVSNNPRVESVLRTNGNDFPVLVVTCGTDQLVLIILSVTYETGLIIACTILGIMSFKYPDNFNEAKYITFCTFALLVIWLGFIPSYFAIQQIQEFQNAVISMAIILSAFVVLVCIFGPKLFIILFHSKLNEEDPTSYHGTNTPTSPKNPPTSTTGSSQPRQNGMSTFHALLPNFSNVNSNFKSPNNGIVNAVLFKFSNKKVNLNI